MERGDLIEQSVIAGDSMFRFARERWVRQKPQRSQSVLEAHHNHAATSEVGPIGARQRGSTAGESSTVDPHHDREPLPASGRRGPDVERETVLARRRRRQRQPARREVSGLRTLRSEARGVSNVSPRFGGAGARHRRSPVGGAAYGMPLNTTTSVPLPRTGPDCV